MKKILFIIASAALMFTACSSEPTPEEKAQQYAEKMEAAIQSGDKEAVKALNEEITTWQSTLTAEEQTKVLSVEAFTKATADADKVLNPSLEDMVKDAVTGVAEELQEMVTGTTEEAVTGAADGIKEKANETMKEATSKASQAMKEATQKASEALNDAAAKASEAINDAAAKAKSNLKIK